jgi:ABC-type antimicrobial peptide transport system permease subunit
VRVYLPFNEDAESVAIVGRAAGGPAALAARLAGAVGRVDGRLVPGGSGTLDDLAARTIEQRRLIRALTGGVALGSLVMVGVGVWGLAETSLRRRWREFGVRQALGATRRHVWQLALADARFVVVAGGLVGLAASWQFGRVLQAYLFGVAAHDPATLAAAAVVVCGAALAGALGPARAAARQDPSALLRQ